MNFELTTLGSASAQPMSNRYPSVHVLNIHGRLFLIDCGEAAQIQLRKGGFSINKIDRIFISHLHGDHVFGLFGLLSSMSMLGRTADIYIHAPAGIKSIIDFYLKQFGEGVKFNIELCPVKTQEPILIDKTKGADIFAFPLNHRIECYGFLFKEREPGLNVHKYLIERENLSLYEIARLKEGQNVIRDNGELLDSEKFTYKPYMPRSFAYCSDTAPFEKLAEWIRGVDLLLHEATFMNTERNLAIETFHSTAAQAADMAKKANISKLVLTHFSARYADLTPLHNEAKDIFPETFLAKEGMNFEVPLKRC